MELYELNTRKMLAEKDHRKAFSGYAMILLSSIIKLSLYLRETEEKLLAKMKTRKFIAMEKSDLKIIVSELM